MNSNEEKRQYQRVRILSPETLLVETNADESWQVETISNAGLGVISRKKLPADMTIVLALELSDGQGPVEIEGKVVWQSSLGMDKDGLGEYLRAGIAITRISKNNRERLIDYIKAMNISHNPDA